MTAVKRIEMFKDKKQFIDCINKAFEVKSFGSSVESVAYEVYEKEINKNTTYFAEYLVVTFIGGAKSVRIANGNNNMANFRELGKLIDGGYYTEVDEYEALSENGFSLVVL
jgi:hypothetical protein